MSKQPQSQRPQQSMAPQQSSVRPQMSQSSRPVDPRIRADPRSDANGAAAPVAAAAAAFDPRAASGAKPKQQLPKFRAVDANTKKIIPSQGMMQQAAALSLQVDKPIILTFWHDSIVGNCVLRENKEENEKIIYKIPENSQEEEEFTSPLVNEHGNGIFETQNSIYIVVPDIRTF